MNDSLSSISAGGEMADLNWQSAPAKISPNLESTTHAGLAPDAQIEASKMTPAGRKLLAGCQEFEGMLLTKWWEGMDKTFGDPTDSEDDAGGDTMRELGIQSAANGIASEGGMGLSALMYKQLAPALPRKP
ncbi:MAG: hypothetical protein ACRD2O_07095 [Terriglobia bacterium]